MVAPDVVDELGAVLQRLDAVLPRKAPWLHDSWAAPAEEADLDDLRRALEPHEVPPEVVAFLRWHDGQREDAEGLMPWWPPLLGGLPLDSAREMAVHVRRNEELWEDGAGDVPFLPVLPLTWHSWSLSCLEVDPDVKRAVISRELSDTHTPLHAPSLAALLDAAADLAEDGLLRQAEVPHEEWPHWYRDAEAVVQDCSARHAGGSWAGTGWSRAQAGPTFSVTGRDWPQHWRARAAVPPHWTRWPSSTT